MGKIILTLMRYLLKNSNGEHSISYTMLVITFAVLTLWLLLSITSVVFGFEIREFPFEGAALWFSSISALYFGRRYADRTTKKVLDETSQKLSPSVPPSEPSSLDREPTNNHKLNGQSLNGKNDE